MRHAVRLDEHVALEAELRVDREQLREQVLGSSRSGGLAEQAERSAACRSAARGRASCFALLVEDRLPREVRCDRVERRARATKRFAM